MISSEVDLSIFTEMYVNLYKATNGEAMKSMRGAIIIIIII